MCEAYTFSENRNDISFVVLEREMGGTKWAYVDKHHHTGLLLYSHLNLKRTQRCRRNPVT